MERDAHERWLQLSQEQQSVILAAAKEKGRNKSLTCFEVSSTTLFKNRQQKIMGYFALVQI